MVKLRPLDLSARSATSFSSSTPPNALVMTKPGLFSWPHARPLVRIELTMTNFEIFAAEAASISLQVPTLSTAWASLPISNGLPPAKPTAHTILSTPSSAAAIWSTLSVISRWRRDLASSAFALLLVGSRTPPMTFTAPAAVRAEQTRRPVLPVAPATNTVFGAAAFAGFAPVNARLAPRDAARAAASRRDGWIAMEMAARGCCCTAA
mmetsp:Transcript_14519/g.28350  ORF Transcript_14519/g.28350 Transcript_14519/m.28350 type:complete len:208 (-) Transcript_14519:178-801(-)